MLARTDAGGDDAYQDAVMTAFQKFDSLRDPQKFRGWLFQIIAASVRTGWRRNLWRRTPRSVA
jgi:DNA-directed RNA polymerase specialized sigma24 family protein